MLGLYEAARWDTGSAPSTQLLVSAVPKLLGALERLDAKVDAASRRAQAWEYDQGVHAENERLREENHRLSEAVRPPVNDSAGLIYRCGVHAWEWTGNGGKVCPLCRLDTCRRFLLAAEKLKDAYYSLAYEREQKLKHADKVVSQVRNALRMVEWVDMDGVLCCPFCFKNEALGHAADCLVGAATKLP